MACALVLLGACGTTLYAQSPIDHQTRAIKGVNFSALIVRDFLEESGDRTVYILMDPSEVNEGNLHTLFKIISEKYPKVSTLRAWVRTDIQNLESLVTGVIITGARGQEKKETQDGNNGVSPASKSKEHKNQRAFYFRTEEVELFRYNPNYPEPGSQTIILKGKE